VLTHPKDLRKIHSANPGVIIMRALPNIYGMSSLEQAGPMHEPKNSPIRLRSLLDGAINVHQVGHNGHEFLQASFNITQVNHENLKDVARDHTWWYQLIKQKK